MIFMICYHAGRINNTFDVLFFQHNLLNKLQTLNFPEGMPSAQTSNFPGGIYFVEINNGKNKAVKKFIKN